MADERGQARRRRDPFGSDLPLYQPEVNDLKDLQRLREINPMIMTPKVAGAERLTVDELEWESPDTDSRHTAGGFLSVAGGAFTVCGTMGVAFGLRRGYDVTRATPWPVRRAFMASVASKYGFRTGVAGVTVVTVVHSVDALTRRLRGGRDDDFNLLAGLATVGGIAGMSQGRGGFRTGFLMFGALWGVVLIVGPALLEGTALVETFDKYWSRYRLGTLLGWQDDTPRWTPKQHQ